MNDFLDLKYEIVCVIAKETIKQLNGQNFLDKQIDLDFDVDYSEIECQVSEKIEKIIEQMKML